MKKILSLLLAVAILLSGSIPAFADETEPPNLPAASESYIVIDAKTGQVLLEKNSHKKEYPASITKIMTTALGVKNGKPDDSITVSKEVVNDIWRWGETTHLALEPGEVITLRDAFYGTMVESANDCANAIAQSVSGNLEDFTALMNQQVTALGLTNTHFTNAHGLYDKDHYTTAYDMAMITRWALSVDGFEEYFCAKSYTIPKTNKKKVERNIGTHHHMIVNSKYSYEYAIGGKLGWTSESKHTIVTWAKKGDLSLICVAMNCQNKWDKYTDTAKLFDYCFDTYDMVSVTADDMASFDVPVGSLQNPSGMVHISASKDLDLLVEKGTPTESVAFIYDIPSRYRAGETIAPQVDVYSGGVLVASVPMDFTVETYRTETEMEKPEKEPSAFTAVLLAILKWMGIILAAIVVVLFGLRAYFMARRRKRRAARRKSASRGGNRSR